MMKILDESGRMDEVNELARLLSKIDPELTITAVLAILTINFEKLLKLDSEKN